MDIAFGVLLFLTNTLFVMGIAIKRAEKNRNIRKIVHGVSDDDSWVEKMLVRIADLLPAFLSTERVDQNLRQAGHPFGWKTANDVMIVRVVVVVVFLVAAGVVETNKVALGLFGVVFGVVTPSWYIYNAKLIRQAKIRKQLRPFNMMLSLLVGTGIPMAEALHETIGTTSGEFRVLLEEMEKRMRLETLVEAFAWLADEIGMREIDRLYTVVEQNKKNGTPLKELLNMMIAEYDLELENKIEKLSQKVNMKVTLVVLFLIVGPSVGFEGIIAGINFLSSLNAF